MLVIILGDTARQCTLPEKLKNDVGAFLFTCNQMFSPCTIANLKLTY